MVWICLECIGKAEIRIWQVPHLLGVFSRPRLNVRHIVNSWPATHLLGVFSPPSLYVRFSPPLQSGGGIAPFICLVQTNTKVTLVMAGKSFSIWPFGWWTAYYSMLSSYIWWVHFYVKWIIYTNNDLFLPMRFLRKRLRTCTEQCG